MGMFDLIECKMPLPIKGLSAKRFQTKDFNCELDQLEINDKGVVYSKDSTYGTVCQVFPSEDFTFYDFIEDPESVEWVEFKAIVKAGIVESIEVVQYRKPGEGL